MRYLRNGLILSAVLIAAAWAQGGRAGRNNAAAQTPTQTAAPPAITAPGATPQAGRGGRGGPVAPATSEFFDFDTTAGSAPPIPDAPPVETRQKITVAGEDIPYTTRAGYIPLRNATTGQTEAHIFYTSYTRDNVADNASRPVLFFVGGAPGVSAAWQEFGGLGPKRMKWKAGPESGPPYEWTDNPNTLLSQTDLVFVNPVGTGYSRPDSPTHASAFWNSSADVASLAAFVRIYLNTNNRRNSPLFLAGEDARTGRAAGLAAYLHEHEIPVQGVVLLSIAPSADSEAGDTEYLTSLPSFVMAAWRHKKLSPELNAMSAEQISGQARQFASREYLHALYKGDRMTAEERTKALSDLARLTGLSKSFLVNNGLRIPRDRFNTELLRDQHLGLSFSDTRITGFLPLPVASGRGGFGAPAPPPLDFNLSGLSGGFQTAYERYLHDELKFNRGGEIFYLSSGGVGTFTAAVTDDASLSAVFARDPHLRLYVGIGYYDLNTPFYAAEFTLAHLNISPEVRGRNITVSHFEAGQMAYLDGKAVVKLQSELSRFIADTISRK